METKELKEKILKSIDLTTEQVEVPEWDCTVTIRTLTGTERDAFEASIIKGKKADTHNIRAKLCAMCIVDDEGKRVFADSDITALGNKSALALDRVYDVATKLNGIGAKEIEELAKNSDSGQSDNSNSD